LVVVAEIMAGSVLFEDNFDLCFMDTIEWSDVVTHRRSNRSFLLNEAERPAPICNCLLLLSISFFVKYSNTVLSVMFYLAVYHYECVDTPIV